MTKMIYKINSYVEFVVGWHKLILKIIAKILEKFFFQKKDLY